MKKYFSKLVLALSVAMIMSLGVAIPAMANPPAALPALGITKNLDRPAGTSSPALSFTFRLTQAQPVGGGPAAGDLVGVGFEVMPTPTANIVRDRVIDYPANMFGQRQTTLTLNNAAGFNAGTDVDILFPNAGVFHFFVEEVHNTNAAAMAADATANPNAQATLTYSTAVHLLTFEVRNVDGQLRVTHVIGQPGTPGIPGSPGTPDNPGTDDFWVAGPKYPTLIPGTPGQPGTPSTPDTPGTPSTIIDPSPLAFTNIFTRNITGTNDNPAFAVTKSVLDTEGLADLTIAYSTITTLTVPSQVFAQPNPPVAPPTLAGTAAPVVVTGSPAAPVIPAPTVTVTGAGTAADPFVVTAPLRDGERLVFPTLPAGTIFGSTEIQHEHYTGEGRAIVAGTNVGTFGDVADNSLAGVNVVVPQLPAHFVSDTDPFNNRIDFVNDYVHADNTGLVITSMPILAVLVAATVILAMMVASRSRKRL
ncbi:MAG: hypothetical protein FWE26_06650, partial [Coriobacteriia bacterium]|nr:hypothetical protein [Coriobacteriia bacterium]